MAMNSALQKRLLGQVDSRGMQGIFSRGKNIYHGGTNAAHSGGGPQYGRPRKRPNLQNAIQRRMKRIY